MKNICIIGAGPSGLTTIKELLDEGHSPVCFEAANDLGGLFNINISSAKVFESTLLTVSNHFIAFSDFPAAEEKRIHWSHQEYLSYLKKYAHHFNLVEHIQFDTKVLHVQENNGKYHVKIVRKNVEHSHIFDSVIVCTGTHQEPNIPDIHDNEAFEGDIIHSAEYLNNKPFTGKKVVVIGIGESSADIVREVSDVSETCHLVIKQYPFIIPRNYDYESSDSNTSMFPLENIYPRNIILRFHALFWSILERLNLTKRKYTTDSFNQSLLKKHLDINTPFSKEAIELIKSWMELEGNTPGNKFATKNASFLTNILNDRLQVKKGLVQRIKSKSVILTCGKEIKCDTILFCTGYKEKFQFLDKNLQIENIRNLYLNAFHPKYKNLVFIGWNRPTVGGVPNCSEMIARYYALVLNHKKYLPEYKEMVRIINQDKSLIEQQFTKSSQIKTLVSYQAFMLRMSQLIGCDIKWNKLILSPQLVYKLVCGSMISYRYRLFGPHSNYKQSKKLICKLNIGPIIKKIALKILFRRLFYLKDKPLTFNDVFYKEVKIDDNIIRKYDF